MRLLHGLERRRQELYLLQVRAVEGGVLQELVQLAQDVALRVQMGSTSVMAIALGKRRSIMSTETPRPP